ncbi:MAG: N-acetyl-gamma-glutamyl-phosphate reductase [Oscillospiraceae bacterium]|nr:N-acetyl-gamma-glutamyl-phosphate reductase [Oscillospiraceae bacterium]MDD3832913.1 N-acetyl-gamma-glutamyl-phosphate reductase [Oscillospiraceae bacterium]MDD4546480.1 N-acetyl-gamma-glutamyl-phosphate reductase [Oscillospiraceae bacterium]
MRIKAGIIGATGYAGVELVRLLLRHPHVTVAAISSVSYEGQSIADIYPSLRDICDLTCGCAQEVIAASDVVFAALPHGLSQDMAMDCIKAGKKFIDLGADFRLDDCDTYMKWYGSEYKHPELHKSAVYGIPELFRNDIIGKSVVGNPGCYPTSIALGLAPALRAGMVDTRGIVIDSKSGVSGAGRKPTPTTHFPECNESFSAYKVAAHRHTPEIEQTLSKISGEKATVTFVPHLLPVNRGILSTMYARLKDGVTLDDVRTLYENTYKSEYFVRLLPQGVEVDVKNVRCSNYCDIQLYTDPNTGLLIVTSVIDNMVKGAAGQAIQNLNLLFGLKETDGIDMIPPAF